MRRAWYLVSGLDDVGHGGQGDGLEGVVEDVEVALALRAGGELEERRPGRLGVVDGGGRVPTAALEDLEGAVSVVAAVAVAVEVGAGGVGGGGAEAERALVRGGVLEGRAERGGAPGVGRLLVGRLLVGLVDGGERADVARRRPSPVARRAAVGVGPDILDGRDDVGAVDEAGPLGQVLAAVGVNAPLGNPRRAEGLDGRRVDTCGARYF